MAAKFDTLVADFYLQAILSVEDESGDFSYPPPTQKTELVSPLIHYVLTYYSLFCCAATSVAVSHRTSEDVTCTQVKMVLKWDCGSLWPSPGRGKSKVEWRVVG